LEGNSLILVGERERSTRGKHILSKLGEEVIFDPYLRKWNVNVDVESRLGVQMSDDHLVRELHPKFGKSMPHIEKLGEIRNELYSP